MKGGKASSGMDTNMIIAGIVIVLIVLGLFFVLMNRGRSRETFSDGKTYKFTTARAGHGKATCTLVNSGEPKDVDEKAINEEKCTVGDKKGWWVCNEVEYNAEGHTRRGCGCMYEIPENDKYNLLKNES